MLENVNLESFPPEIAKLISAFALAAQQSGMDDDAVHKLFENALKIYNTGYLTVPRLRYDA